MNDKKQKQLSTEKDSPCIPDINGNSTTILRDNQDEEDLLLECLMIKWRLLEHRCDYNFKIKKSIQRLVNDLYHRYGITRYEIDSLLNNKFLLRNRHLKYDPQKSSLERYVAWFVYYELMSMKRQCRRLLQRERTVPLSELIRGDDIDRSGCSLWPYEKEGIDELINPVSPEDEIIAKELLQEAQDFFGYDDLAVLLGVKDRHDEAKRLGMDYYSYCKRVNRKIERFRSHLNQIGYPC